MGISMRLSKTELKELCLVFGVLTTGIALGQTVFSKMMIYIYLFGGLIMIIISRLIQTE